MASSLSVSSEAESDLTSRDSVSLPSDYDLLVDQLDSASSPSPSSSSPSSSILVRTRVERVMMKRLCRHLSALRSMIPANSRSSRSSVIADAVRYKKALKREISRLEKASPHSNEVEVVKEGANNLRIKVACKKKAGLLIALMEVMESSGLVFSSVNVCCTNGISIEALSKPVCDRPTPSVISLKIALMATIRRFSHG